MTLELDRSFQRFVASVPDALRAEASALPFKLGLVHRPDGRWSDFTQIPAVHSMPSALMRGARDAVRSALVGVDESAYLEAHRLAGFYCVLVDRVADGQVVPDRALRALRRLLRAAWVDAVAVFAGERAERAVARAERALRRAIRRERAGFASGKLPAPAYAAAVRDKTVWLALATRELLRAHAARSADAFGRAHVLFFGSLQCLDDAMDVEEDSAVRGGSFPALLGVSVRAMWLASQHLVARAADEFRHAGFGGVAEELELRVPELAAACQPADGPGASVLDAVAALTLIEAFELDAKRRVR